MKSSMQQRKRVSRMCLVEGSAALALVTLLILAVITTGAAQAQTFKTLFSFDGSDGSSPFAGLTQGTNGDFYGTAKFGGANGGYGTVFKISPAGTLTTLYNFCSQPDCADGYSPTGGVLQATNGNFYGIANLGGANGDGTVFKITAAGKLTTLYNFCSQPGCADGSRPFAGLVQGTNGAFYGTASIGGAIGEGTVFKIEPSGKLTTLYSFCSQSNCTDGANPEGVLVQGTDENFYGTTFAGGAKGDYGTFFKITPSGKLTTLYSFCTQSGCADGYNPQAGLIQDANGDFYGTTLGGGNSGDYGTFFRITSGGELTTLYRFCSQSSCADGYNPSSELVRAASGDFYATTSAGGANAQGTIFSITPTGTLTTLYSFCSTGCTIAGYYPTAGLLQSTNGTFYGTTYEGGTEGAGTIYSLSIGLGPFVEAMPNSGKVGAAVEILGTNLTGATSVSFNGTQATFRVISSTEIKTNVPTAATTGIVQVTTQSGGTLTSNVPFRVSP
jgi:uncharacterized repeat protein (TIGR03803 family)